MQTDFLSELLKRKDHLRYQGVNWKKTGKGKVKVVPVLK
jgi:hypothetical protein